MLSSGLAVLVLLNGTPIDFGAVPEFQPYLQDGVVMVPVRPVLEAMGATVDYGSVGGTRKSYYEAYVTYKGKEVALRSEYARFAKLAERTYWPRQFKPIKAQEVSGFVPPSGGKYYEGYASRVMMPLGFLSSTFNFSLKWDAKKKAAYISLNPLPEVYF
jgi:hypothetical protein